MLLRTYFFARIRSLTRWQKRLIFTLADMATASIVIAAVLGVQISLLDVLMLISVAAIAAFASAFFGLSRIKLNAYGRHALLSTSKYAFAVTFGSAATFHIGGVLVKAGQLAECVGLLIVACMATRYFMLMALLYVLRHGQTRCRVLIYGAGETGQQMANALRGHPGILPVAFLDDDVDLQVITVAGLPVLAPARAEEVHRDLGVDRVLLAMPSASAPKLAKITRKLKDLGLEVQALPSFAQLVGTDLNVLSRTQFTAAHFLGRSALADEVPDISAAYGGRAIMVSGAGGSVGSELCRQLLASRPKSLILFERSELALYTIDQELRLLLQGQDTEIIPVLGCVTDGRLAQSIMINAQAEIVFHAAAYKHLPLVEANPIAGLANNVVGTKIFAQSAVAAGVSRFVLISTDKAVRPTSIMGGTKKLSEQVVQDMATRTHYTRFSIVRFGNVLGSSGSVVPLFRDQIARGGPVTLTHDDVTRFFMTLAEAARLVLYAGALEQQDVFGNVFALNMGQPVRIRDLAERMIKAQGLTLKTAADPSGDIEIVVTGLRKGEKLHEQLFTSNNLLPTPHPKILRLQEHRLSEFAVASMLGAAKAAIETGDQSAARAVIWKWVAEPLVGRPGSCEQPEFCQKALSACRHCNNGDAAKTGGLAAS